MVDKANKENPYNILNIICNIEKATIQACFKGFNYCEMTLSLKSTMIFNITLGYLALFINKVISPSNDLIVKNSKKIEFCYLDLV